MTDWIKRRERKNEVAARAAEPSLRFHTCRVVGCGKRSRAATQDGLDTFFCRSHADHHSRHGSPYKRSYTAKEIAPHRKRARAWLEANQDDMWVTNAVQRVQTLYANAGPHVEAFRLNGLSPQERSKAAWARLRKANIDPRQVIAACIAVELTVQADPQPDSKSEFRRVQMAKQMHKLASGTHKQWPSTAGGPKELHVYPRSRGQVLRHLGVDLEKCIELLISHATW
ncbi:MULTISPECIES: hypothetical protein [unclassified Rhizobium]|uniref:hypothetical protein n=1 Tax=unclassified Rhizobium TaxID=2613769 RepID=UPI001FD7A063|nr:MULTISPECIES: hypothetical protein [unclassified Rhizobium]